MKMMHGTSSNTGSMHVLRAKLLLSQSYAASLEYENETMAQQMQEVELQAISDLRHEFVDIANRLDAWSRLQEESHRKEMHLLNKLQQAEEELQLARAHIEESDQKYAELLTYAKENLNQVEKEKALLRRKLAKERRKNATDERTIVTQIILESDDASALDIDDDATEVESIAAFLLYPSIDQSTQTDDLIGERNTEVENLSLVTTRNKSSPIGQSSIEKNDSVSAEEVDRRPWHKDVGNNQSVHRHIQNQLSRQACELKALRKDRILLQSQLDHCRWLLWDLEEYRNWNRQKTAVHRRSEPFQLLEETEGPTDLIWQKKIQHFDMLTQLLMKEVDQKNTVISEMSTVCTPMEALSCVHREQERSLKLAAVTSVALAESQMKVDELTAAMQRMDMSQRSSGGVKKSQNTTIGNTTIDPASTKNASDSDIGKARMGASYKTKSAPFLMTDQTEAAGMLMDFKRRDTNHQFSGNATSATSDRSQPALLRGPSRNKIITDDLNNSNFNSKIQSLFRSSAIEGVAKPVDPAAKDLETTIRTLQGRIAILEQENNVLYASSRVLFP